MSTRKKFLLLKIMLFILMGVLLLKSSVVDYYVSNRNLINVLPTVLKLDRDKNQVCQCGKDETHSITEFDSHLTTPEMHYLALTLDSPRSAARYYEEIFRERGDVSALFLAGKYYGQCGDLVSMLRTWRQVPRIEDYFLSQYSDAVRTGNLEEAVPVLSMLTNLFPDDPTYWHSLGKLYENLGDYSRSMKYYLVAIHLNPDNPRLNYDVGVLHIKLDQDAEAITYLSRATASVVLEDRVRYYAYIRMANTLHRLNRFSDACNAAGATIGAATAADIVLHRNAEMCRQKWVFEDCSEELAQIYAKICDPR